MDEDIIKKIKICLEQKIIFITNFSDLSKQIEVKSMQEDVIFDNLFERRQTCMERIDKCNALIDSTINDLSDLDKDTMLAVINCTMPDQDCPEELVELLTLTLRYKELLVIASESNKLALETFSSRHSELRNVLNTLRKGRPQTNMYR